MVERVIGYRKTYRLREAAGSSKKSLEVTFPYEVVEKEARELGISVDEFLERFQVTAEYDNFVGVLYTFLEIANESGEPTRVAPES